MQKQKVKLEKVKAVLKKCLDVFCYISTALAVTLGIAMGVNSCSGSNEPERIDPQQVETSRAVRGSITDPNYEDYWVYVSRFEGGTYEQDFDSWRSVLNVPATTSAVMRSNISRTYNLPSAGYILGTDMSYHQIARISVVYKDFLISADTNQYEYKLWYADIRTYDPLNDSGQTAFNLIIRENNASGYATDESYIFARIKIVLATQDMGGETIFNLLFVEDADYTITFNANFNYNAPSGLQYNAVYMDQLDDSFWTGGGQETGVAWKDYNLGWFVSNGRLFDTIRWYCSAGSGLSVVIDDQITQLEYAGNWVYTYLYYRNSYDNTSVIVNTRDSIPYNAGNNRYYANSSTWQVPAYRHIKLLTQPTPDIVDLVASFNNNNAYDVGLTYGGGFADVFSLVGGAFTGILPILTLQVLPSVTIGTLLFVPLVAILVFAIIRIIKK